MIKMIQWLVIALCICVSIPASAQTPKPKFPVGVVIPKTAKLYASKAAKKPFLEGKGLQGFVTVDLIKEDGAWLHVGHRGWVNGSCYGSISAHGIDFDFWVKKKDVATVTTDEVSVPLKGKTAVRLSPGVAVTKGKIHLDQGKFVLNGKVPSSKTGVSFQGNYMKFGAVKFAYEKSQKGILVGGKRYTAYDHEIILDSMEEGKNGKFKAKSPIQCAELHGFFDDVKIKDKKAQQNLLGVLGSGKGIGGLGLSGKGKKASKIYKVQTGTQVFWPNGDPAGIVAGYLTFTDPPEGKKNVCKKITPYYAKDKKKVPSFELCVPRNSLTEQKLSANRLGSGSISNVFGSGTGLGTKSKSAKGPKDKVKVSFKNVSVAGTLSKDDVLFRIEKSVGAFRHCHLSEYKSGTIPATDVALTATIGANGRTTVKSGKVSNGEIKCAEQALRMMTFAPTGGTTDINLTVKFTPR